MIAVDRRFKPVVGIARTGMIRARERMRGPAIDHIDWYDYMRATDLPTIATIQDIDPVPG